jgi:hypothetical protein
MTGASQGRVENLQPTQSRETAVSAKRLGVRALLRRFLPQRFRVVAVTGRFEAELR